jgi:hypothetical protein
VLGGVVIVFDPVGEPAVEGFERRQVELLDQKLVANPTEEAFDFSLGSSVTNRSVSQQATDASADERDLLRAIDRTGIDEELFGHAAFVEGRTAGFHQGVNVLVEEEFAVAEHPAGVVEEGNELGRFAGTE